MYKQMDWFSNTGVAIGVFCGLCVGEVLIIYLVYVLSKYVKLPKYEKLFDEQNARKVSGKLTLQGSREDNIGS